MVDPATDLNYCRLGTISDMDSIVVSKSAGIVAKFNAARLLSGFGIEMVVGTGNAENESPFMENEGTVTRVKPRGQRLGQMKSWIALAAASKGELEVSTFLADNLRNGRAVSILVIGVENVRGLFSEGDVVTVIDAGGSILGRGRCRISSARLSKLVGALGNSDISINSRTEIVIRCDYFALNPMLAK
ncbi:MAG: hypothetical protein HY313_00300 [Acidobacteria bacterium]|nr:hypothetical protein [Acidobacteriota bacterium]